MQKEANTCPHKVVVFQSTHDEVVARGGKSKLDVGTKDVEMGGGRKGYVAS